MDKFIEKFISELLEPQTQERVLDIGCGAGNHLLFLNKLGLDITGIDASPYMINLARNRLGDRCNLKIGIAEDLPFNDNEFDLAVLINTLEFLDDPLKALREAGRVAKKNVFICVINSLSWRCVCDKLHGLFFETISTHIHPYHIWELKSYVRRAYGPVPMIWRSGPPWPNGFEVSQSSPLGSGCWPFGPFLGLLATIEYRFKTDNLPLKIRVGKIEQPVVDGIASLVNPDQSRIP